MAPGRVRPLYNHRRSGRSTRGCFVSLYQIPGQSPAISMKRPILFVIFFAILGVSLAGLYWSQRRAKSPPVSPNAILNLAADAQRDITRIPMHFTRLSDEQEITIGRQLSANYSGVL